MEKAIPKNIPFLTPCLLLEASDDEDNKEESDYVTFVLKVRAGTGSTAPSYRMKVAKFEDGTPAEWIDVVNALEDILKQNSMNLAHDCEASIKTILREDALTAFEASIDNSIEQPEDAEDDAADIVLNNDMIGLEGNLGDQRPASLKTSCSVSGIRIDDFALFYGQFSSEGYFNKLLNCATTHQETVAVG
jgi:hypothetical protein